MEFTRGDNPLESLNVGMSKAYGIIEYLWDIIDDIDSAGDMAKSDDKFYRKMVERLQAKRWETKITSDGYELDLSDMKVPKPIPGHVLKNKKKMKVVHCKKEPHDVYIGRPSKWGNPFSHLEDSTQAEFKVKDRKEAIDSYRAWITEGDGKHLLKDLHELEGKVLGCWCKPKSCHGDVLVELLEKNTTKLF